MEWTLKPAQTRAALGAIDFTSVLGELGMSENRCFSELPYGGEHPYLSASAVLICQPWYSLDFDPRIHTHIIPYIFLLVFPGHVGDIPIEWC